MRLCGGLLAATTIRLQWWHLYSVYVVLFSCLTMLLGSTLALAYPTGVLIYVCSRVFQQVDYCVAEDTLTCRGFGGTILAASFVGSRKKSSDTFNVDD